MSLEKLPIELIHKIFNYLQTHDIFLSFYNINIYLNKILNIYDKYQLNFQTITMKNFNLTLDYINPCQVICLTLSNLDDTPGQFHLFLSLFSLKQFTSLQSLQLIQPTNPLDLNKILMDLSTLNSLRSLSIIHCQPSSVNQETFLILSSYLNQSKNLHRLYLSGTLNTIFEYNFLSSIQYLYFNDNIFNTITLQTLTTRMPYLKTLDTAITLNIKSIDSLLFINLTHLTMTIFINLNNSDLKILFHQMSSLKFLKIFANGKQWFNGHFWEESLPLNLQIFHFNFSTQSIYTNEQSIIETFQTSFWLEKKSWYVMLDYQINPTMIHLYSLPYCDTQFYYRPSMDPSHQFRSSIAIPKSYLDNVTKLTVDLSTLITESNLLFKTIHYFPNILTLTLSDNDCYLPVEPLFNFLKSFINLSHIVELKLGHFYHPDLIEILYKHIPKLHSLRITERIYSKLEMLHFHNITSLTICDCLTDIERMYLMFPYVKHLCIKLITFEEMIQLLKLLDKTLINITFRQINHNLKEEFINWLHEYYHQQYRRFSYDIDEHMNLHLWLDDLSI